MKRLIDLDALEWLLVDLYIDKDNPNNKHAAVILDALNKCGIKIHYDILCELIDRKFEVRKAKVLRKYFSSLKTSKTLATNAWTLTIHKGDKPIIFKFENVSSIEVFSQLKILINKYSDSGVDVEYDIKMSNHRQINLP